MKLSEINTTLQEIRVSPIKTLGQNFLHDQNLARWIVERADLTSRDYIVEIGPGLGALTEFALANGARVLAIEKDARLASFLREKFRDQPLEVLHADALKFDVRSLYARPQVKLLGNLPYYVSSQLLLKFLEYPSPISLWLLMLQKEMARRLSAAPATRDYGALTLQVQLHYRVEYLRTVPASVFLPQPEVDSAIVRITPRDPTELPERDDELFMKLVRNGFSQRRKQLQNLLREDLRDWDAAARALGFDAKARAEELSLLQWIGLANQITSPFASTGPSPQQERFPVVDEADRILRYGYRSKVHGDNLRHRAVHMLIFNAAGEVFLQKRSRRKDRHPLLWDSSAAGHVNAGEDYDAAAQRELKEELGLDVALEKISKLPASDRTGQEFIWLYRGELRGDLRPNRSEIETGAFFPPSIVDDWIMARPEDFAPGFVECWKAYRQRKPT
jgi:16S rRNA (adenine1518-N6/adenine1519-N6)-dimethyltransferase